ncbi:TetR/AcrR family transcriptional regulator [Pseudohongiella sp.]|uniref:HTH tetR-type domain-containing protein n=1 Tax=marine sediment metagenome TaxID=412755 RepID=A0A0F9VZ19_9ZZZZ|nr:TetR/AcrR family transcriptional regulator [Pseudohongiella sp.]
MTGENTARKNQISDEPDLASMGLRERKKLIRLQRIVAAARQLFINKGFTTTTIQDIAVEADVGLGTLYLYAKSKEDLLVLVFKDDILVMIDESYAAIAPGEPLIDQLMAFFDGHINYHLKDQALSRMVLKELSFSTTEQRRQDIDQIMNSTYAKLMKLIERARRDGRLQKEVFTGTMAWSTFALYYHLLQGFLCGFHSEEEFRKSLRNALAALLT